MRKVGYLLVVAGFTWLAALQAVQFLRGGVRPILRTQYFKVDAGERSTIPAREVIELIRDTAAQLRFSASIFVARCSYAGWYYFDWTAPPDYLER
jgi:hypothetical protein